MATNPPMPASAGPLSNYQLRLPGYEGPLDILLRLIERNQMDITDVSLVAVTSQFLEYMTSLAEAPDSVVASFTTVGTRLAVLKSRSLLPKPSSQDEDDGPSDLTRQLLEYRAARDASVFLANRHASDMRSYTRVNSNHVDAELKRSSERLGMFSPLVLVQSLRRRLSVVPRPARMIPRRKMVSLRQTVNRILELTQNRNGVGFSTVVEQYASRTEVATAFLGMLVLIRRNVITVRQTALFGEIELGRKEGQPPERELELEETF